MLAVAVRCAELLSKYPKAARKLALAGLTAEMRVPEILVEILVRYNYPAVLPMLNVRLRPQADINDQAHLPL